MNLQGKTKEDEEKGIHGVGQLLIAMVTQFVKNKGKNSLIGFTVSPSTVSLATWCPCVLCFLYTYFHYSCLYLTCQHCATIMDPFVSDSMVLQQSLMEI